MVALSPSVLAALEGEDAFSWTDFADIGNMLRYEPQGSLHGYRDRGGALEKGWRMVARQEDLVALLDVLRHTTTDTPRRSADLVHLIGQTVSL